MCIIFFHVDAKNTFSDYKLIIAANRDEYFSRPALPMNFLNENPEILSGLDMKPDHVGGMWMGMTRSGRFGFLTNYLTPYFSKESGSSRGPIVRNFLFSKCAVDEYVESLVQDSSYKPFNFIGGQLSQSRKSIEMCYYSNTDSASPYHLSDGDYVLGCANLGVQWKKISYGSSKFKRILNSHSQATPEELTDSLLNELLSDKTPFYPDPLIEKQCDSKMEPGIMKPYCSVMVAGLERYGTRAHTVILVDKNDQVFASEKSLAHTDDLQNEWKIVNYTFSLDFVTNSGQA